MAKKIRVEVDTKELKKVMDSLVATNGYRVKVGILASKNTRKGGVDESNASIGAVHEYGSYSRNIPQRSFIKMPLVMKSGEIAKEIKELLHGYLENKKRVPLALIKKIGVVAEKIIGQAFASDGFGTWDPISYVTANRKDSEAILIETSQLQRSITSAVEKVS